MKKSPKYRWISLTTGQIVTNIFEVIKASREDRRLYGIKNKWKYNRKGW